MSNELLRIVILTSAVILSFTMSKINLHSYELAIALILFILLFLTKKMLPPKNNIWKLMEAFIFTLITVFTVLSTGGTNSSFFFLIYFLIFSLSMLFEPIVSLSISMIIIFLFIVTSPINMAFKSLLPIFSLAFLSPFALLLSQERVEFEKLKILEESGRENTFLFLSLTLKKHLNSIKDIAGNFKDEKDAHAVKNQVKIIEKLIEKYEKD